MSENIIKIIKYCYDEKLLNHNYDFISEFTFIWGVFENQFRIKSNSLNLERINTVFSKANTDGFLKIKENTLPEQTESFIKGKDVIIIIEKIEFKIELLCQNKDIEFFKRELSSKNFYLKEDRQSILLYLFIAYRVRNNLFHGNKEFIKLHKQKYFFEILNTFLTEISFFLKSAI